MFRYVIDPLVLMDSSNHDAEKGERKMVLVIGNVGLKRYIAKPLIDYLKSYHLQLDVRTTVRVHSDIPHSVAIWGTDCEAVQNTRSHQLCTANHIEFREHDVNTSHERN